MTTYLKGSQFPKSSQWYADEKAALTSIQRQIEAQFPHTNNLIINTTWFGPQFDNGEYASVLKMAENNIQLDNIFFVSMVDEVMITPDQINDIKNRFNSKLYCIGNFDNEYQFNFISTTLPKYFTSYCEEELKLTNLEHIFLCYNRKPRQHRIDLIDKLIENKLENLGVLSLGKNDPTYSKKLSNISILLNETPDQFAKAGNWGMPMNFGIPHDIHSLGNMKLWQTHFLNIVGETIFDPWDDLFVTEKTWKPIIGLRPFIINGQAKKIYKYLRDNGFKTFNHYFNNIELENVKEFEVHDSIISVIQYLIKMEKKEILSMYNDMIPDLQHNRNRFFEFAKEQSNRIEHLF